MFDILSFLCLELNATASAGDLSTDQLQNITTTIVNDVQLGSTLKTLLNTTGVAISEPPPDPEDPNWQTVAKENKNEGYEKLVQPSQMRLHSPIVPLHEGAPFSTPAQFQIYDVDVSFKYITKIQLIYCKPTFICEDFISQITGDKLTARKFPTRQ